MPYNFEITPPNPALTAALIRSVLSLPQCTVHSAASSTDTPHNTLSGLRVKYTKKLLTTQQRYWQINNITRDLYWRYLLVDREPSYLPVPD